MKWIRMVFDEEEQVHVPIQLDEEGRLARYYFVKGPLASKIADYEAMKQDLKECLEYVSLLINFDSVDTENTLPTEVITSLYFAAVIKYGKCYTANKSGRIQLEKNKTLSGLDQRLLDLHDHILALRHSFVAHRDKSDNELAHIVLILNADENKKKVIDERIVMFKKRREEISLADHLLLMHKSMVFAQNKIATFKLRMMKDIEQLGLDKVYNDSKPTEGREVIGFPKFESFFDTMNLNALTMEEE